MSMPFPQCFLEPPLRTMSGGDCASLARRGSVD